jgi:hypothetical protein
MLTLSPSTSSLLDRKIEETAAGLQTSYLNHLRSINKSNALAGLTSKYCRRKLFKVIEENSEKCSLPMIITYTLNKDHFQTTTICSFLIANIT